jgi:hypothetical protein
LRQALGTIDARDVRSTNSLRQHELEVTLTECLIFSDACNGTVMRKSKLPFSLQDCLDTSKSIKSADIWHVAFTTDRLAKERFAGSQIWLSGMGLYDWTKRAMETMFAHKATH